MIEEKLYNQIIDLIPILCVDGFILFDNKILLLKRNNEPAKNQWWVPGGRVLKNETLNEAIKRKMLDEINLNIDSVDYIEQIDIAETIFENKHTVNICYLIVIKEDNISITTEHSEFGWFELSKLPKLDNILIKIINKCENINSRRFIER